MQLPARPPSLLRLILVVVALGMPALATASNSHTDSAAPVALALALMLVLAKVGGHFATVAKQPAVLGELVVGVVLGNLTILVEAVTGKPLAYFSDVAADPSIDMLSRLGVILLLFEAGLESTVAQMLKVGVSALLVATVGVAAPFALGAAVSFFLLPGHSLYVHLFIGATLTATSVGITARVLQDLNRGQLTEARIILGAAVIDDVMGLVILAVVNGIVTAANTGSQLSGGEVALTLAKAVAFLLGSLFLGRWVSPRMFKLASFLRARMVLLAFGLGFCFFLAWLSDLIGLAPIVGAFAAGLILEDVHYQDIKDRDHHTLDELVKPISYFLVPLFFVRMGMRTDLRFFAQPGVVALGAVLLVVAVAGKLVAGLAARGKGLDRLSIGIGMVPRGEVGLIFADAGTRLVVGGEPVVSPNIFSALLMTIIVTTMLTPPLLRWSLARREKGKPAAAQS